MRAFQKLLACLNCACAAIWVVLATAEGKVELPAADIIEEDGLSVVAGGKGGITSKNFEMTCLSSVRVL